MNSDRHFCGTVYVISQTVALILSPRKFGTHVCIIPKLFCMKSGQIWQRRGIYLTQEIWTSVELDMENSVHWWIVSHQWKQNIAFSNSGIFVDGRNKEKRISNSKLAELCASQWYICQAELKEVNFEQICWQCHHRWKLFDSFDELVSSLEITNSKKFSTSELLITSEIVEHWTFSV